MAFRRAISILAAVATLGAVAPAAVAQDALMPDARTHVDPAEGTASPAGAGADNPRLTLLREDTDAADVRRGYLYVIARCNARCVVDVTATTKISGKNREIAAASKTLPANKVRRIKMRIRSDVRRRLAGGARFRFTAFPLPPLGG